MQPVTLKYEGMEASQGDLLRRGIWRADPEGQAGWSCTRRAAGSQSQGREGIHSPAALPGCSLPSCHPVGTASPEVSMPEVNTPPCQTASPYRGDGLTPGSSTVLQQRDLVLPRDPAVTEGFPCVLLTFKQGKFMAQTFAWHKGNWVSASGAKVTLRAVFAGEGRRGKSKGWQGRTTAFFARIVFS